METVHCENRLFIVTNNDEIFVTCTNFFIAPPSNEEYSNIIYAEMYDGSVSKMTVEDIAYIISVIDWYMPDGNHSPFAMMLNPEEVWPEMDGE